VNVEGKQRNDIDIVKLGTLDSCFDASVTARRVIALSREYFVMLGGGKASKAVTIVVQSVVVNDQMMTIKFLENEPRVSDHIVHSRPLGIGSKLSTSHPVLVCTG
jgi:hypothetical protein